LRGAGARGTRFAARRRPATRAALLGAATALLPCGWLYAFVVAAAGSGSAARGALVLLAFFLGTVPLLLLVAVGARRLAEPLRRLTPAAGAVALLLLGAVALGGRFSVPALNTAGAAGDVGEAVRSIDQEALPCCGAETSRDADH